MIGSLRNQLKTKGFQTILWITLLSFVVGLVVQVSFRSKSTLKSVGSVNGYPLSGEDFIRRLNQEQRQIAALKEYLGADAEEFLKAQGYTKPEERVLDELVGQQLIHSAAHNLGVQAQKGYVQNKLSDTAFVLDVLGGLIPQEALRGGLDPQVISEYLQRMGISDSAFEELAQTTLERDIMQKILTGAVYTPQAAVREQYIRRYSKKKYAIITYALANALKQVKAEQPEIAESELQDFYRKHSHEYVVAEKRSGLLWTFEADKYGVVITPKQIQDYYTSHKQQFIGKPEEIDIVRAVAQTRTDLEKLKKAGGKLPGQTVTLKRGASNDKIQERAAFALGHDSEMSDVIQVAQGFELLQRIAKRPATFKSVDAVTDEIKKQLTLQLFGISFVRDAQRVIAQSKDMPNVWTTFIADKKGSESAINPLEKDSSQLARKLFGLKTAGNKAFYQESNKGYIVELTHITASYLPEFAVLKSKITADYYTYKARQSVEKALNKGQDMLHSGKSAQEVAQELKGSVQVTSMLAPDDSAGWKVLEEQKVPVGRMRLLASPKAALVELGDEFGYLIQLLEVDPVNEGEFAQKKAELAKSMHQTQSSLVQAGFLGALKSKAKIELNTTLLNQVRRGV